jgi:hypothetical protein
MVQENNIVHKVKQVKMPKLKIICTGEFWIFFSPFFSLALQPPWALASDFQFHDNFTDGRTPWTSDQLVARPLLKHRTTQTQNKHIPNIHALCGIRTHDPGFRASGDSTCLRPLGYRDRLSSRLHPEYLWCKPALYPMSIVINGKGGRAIA